MCVLNHSKNDFMIKNNQEIAIVYPGGGPKGQDRSPFINVDTTTLEGVKRAERMGFADSGLGDVAVAPFIYELNDMFTPKVNGRLFTVFRHPIERAVSMFYYIQQAEWEPTYDVALKGWSLRKCKLYFIKLQIIITVYIYPIHT